jgi:threonine dehydrogenase-like Zn-dependent dehydrogenase
MRALLLKADGPTLVDDYPCPEPAADEALVRVSVAGVCSTDLELVRGYAGFEGVLGHEFVGHVEACEAKEWVGRRVVGEINLGCRSCAECLGHGTEHCPRRSVLGIIGKDGAFAEYLTLPVANLLQVPDDLPDEDAVFTEPLAAALRIRQQIVVSPSARVAVLGPGRLGLLIAQVLALAGTRPLLLGRRRQSLQLADRLGLATGLVEEAASDSYELVVEATGNDAGLAHALRLVRARGTLVLKSTFKADAQVDLTKLVVGEVRVVGSRCGPFAPALRLLEQEAVAVRPMVHGEYALADGLRALSQAARPGVLKILLRP